jgi:hypothetical protein
MNVLNAATVAFVEPVSPCRRSHRRHHCSMPSRASGCRPDALDNEEKR